MRICVFCGSRVGKYSEIRESTRLTGREIGKRGHTLVYGAASSGLMGELADAVIGSGGRVIGVMSRVLEGVETVHPAIHDVHNTDDIHERKSRMFELSDAFLVLPGGYGTLEEFAEVISWRRMGILKQPIAFLNVQGMYDHLISLLSTMGDAGFLELATVDELIVSSRVTEVLDRLEAAVG